MKDRELRNEPDVISLSDHFTPRSCGVSLIDMHQVVQTFWTTKRKVLSRDKKYITKNK